MKIDTDILIVGAGPTGLMLACQLNRFNIPFKIIDNNPDRVHESRAFGIQARTMEIFQNLGIVDEFLKQAERGAHARLFVNGKEKLAINIDKLNIEGTPFPTLYFMPQDKTEEILINHLNKNNISITRNTELVNFTQNEFGIIGEIKNSLSQQSEKIYCRYIVGCDGAHSKVRKLLKIDFEGSDYKQEFMLADGEVEWSLPKDNSFRMFLSKEGIFGVIPLPNRLDRILAARTEMKEDDKDKPPSIRELETLGSKVTYQTIALKTMVWSSRFHLHHRAVKHYQNGRAFIAGDAAHIHTPAGGQGMNTGIQDVTNLAWKLAFVIKYGSPDNLLATYQTERHYIGQVLVKTTDRVFGLMTSQNIFVKFFRFNILPHIMQYINKKPLLQQRMFLFMSQLRIRYYKSEFVKEETTNADKKFLSTLEAGCRAPDAEFENTTLFEIFRNKICTILIFTKLEKLTELQKTQLDELKNSKNLINILPIEYSTINHVIFDRYGVSDSAIYFIRPDGYIGFRSYGLRIDELLNYIDLLIPQVR